jgi:hypothetical protein
MGGSEPLQVDDVTCPGNSEELDVVGTGGGVQNPVKNRLEQQDAKRLEEAYSGHQQYG